MLRKKLIQILRPLFVLLFWLSIWEAAALLVKNEYFLPGAITTFKALFAIAFTKGFLSSIFLTLSRVLLGLFLGVFLGAILAYICHKIPLINALFSPIVSVIKATPVATFIILLWIYLNANQLTVLIAFLMVMPIIWQNLKDGLATISTELSEAALIFGFSFSRRMRILVIPHLFSYFAPALITSVGLAWKSEIAAEIIAYTKNSIGQHINDNKYFMNTPSMFAWTLVVIVISIIFERLVRMLLRRIQK